MKVEGYIPLDQCEDGTVYRIRSRNLSIGVFVKDRKGFIGIREKFGNEFLFMEYHWDTGEPFGTVCPMEKLAVEIPKGIPIIEHDEDKDEVTKRPVAFDKPIKEGGRGWYFTDTNEADQSIRAVYIENKALFNFLKKIEKEYEN